MPGEHRLMVRHAAGRYPIVITPGGLEGLAQTVRPWAGRASALVTDRHVDELHGDAASTALAAAGVPHERIVVEPGEPTKSFGQLRDLLERLLEMGVPRDGLVVALGGGVVGDLVGLAASLLRRGVASVQVPTSLLAQVDSAVGGKTAVNSAHGKNLIGTFHQPAAVFVSSAVLSTLPEVELRAGLGEVVKYGLLAGEELLGWIEQRRTAIQACEPEVVAELVLRCLTIKRDIVERDEREGGERRLLNLGHTLGHALERATGYTSLRHGEAVAIGLVAACQLSEDQLDLPSAITARVRDLLTSIGHPVRSPAVRRSELHTALVQDKKMADGTLRWVLLRGVGEPEIVRSPVDAAIGTLEMLSKTGVVSWISP